MKTSITCIAIIIVACGCSQQESQQESSVSSSVPLPPRLQDYFEQYCNESDGMGIDFVAWHHYDFRFRQHLRAPKDPELIRLFVLKRLTREIEIAVRNLEEGMMRPRKGSPRPLTPAEATDARQRMLEQINDLSAYFAFTNYAGTTPDPYEYFDPRRDTDLNARWIAEFRERIQAATNAPGANATP